MKKILTLCLYQQGGQLLLGRKKRGFGLNKWNGFGGKVQAQESIEQAARREMMEECALEIESMDNRGLLQFTFEDGTNDLEVHVFAVTQVRGQPRETEEMEPCWFSIEQLPFDQMWADDVYWMPLFLKGNHFAGEFHFKNSEQLLTHHIWEVE